MPSESTICWCCGASSWTKAVAWIEIVGSILYLIFTFSFLEDAKWTSFSISAIICILRAIMGIILLNGMEEKRVSFIKVWITFESILLAVVMITDCMVIRADPELFAIVNSVVKIALLIFPIIVVYIHMKEINEGVFASHNKTLPVT